MPLALVEQASPRTSLNAPEAAVSFTQFSFARARLCSVIPLKIAGVAKNGRSTPCFTSAPAFGLAFASFVLASLTALISLYSLRNRQNCEARAAPPLDETNSVPHIVARC